jgi:hypothetical protein
MATRAGSGNPISDANSQTVPAADTAGISAAVANLNATVASVEQLQQATASDCIWPPSAKINIPLTLPLLPIHYTQSFQVPCLLSYGQARAVAGASILVAGLVTIQFGLAVLIAVPVAEGVATLVGYATGARATGRAARGFLPKKAPEPKKAPATTKSDVTPAA